MAKKERVHLELGMLASPDDVRSLAPEALVVAAGGSMAWPPGLPATWREEGWVLDLRACAMQMLEFRQHQGGTAVIFDMDGTDGTYASAEMLKRLFDRVVIVTPRDRIAEDVPLVRRLGILRRFAHLGIESLTLCDIDAGSTLEDGVIGARNIYTGRILDIPDVALFTYSSARVPNGSNFHALEAELAEFHIIGDAYAAGTVMAATSAGHRVGNLL